VLKGLDDSGDKKVYSKVMNKEESLTYIDLFAGAGGLSEGFIRAGFTPIAHVEMDDKACLTLKTRIAAHYLRKHKNDSTYDSYLKGEIDRKEFYSNVPPELLNTVINKEISEQTIHTIFNQIDELLEKKTVDLVIGGPPCQAYSVIGRSRDPNRMVNDSRNFLYKYYLDFLDKYKPSVFVFENVRGLLSAGNDQQYLKALENGFKDIGYEADYKILDASNFGVLQNRKRVIFIGWKTKLNLSYPTFKEEQADESLKDLWRDLPSLKPGEGKTCSYNKYDLPHNHYLKRNHIRNGKDFITQHKARPHNDRDLEIYKIAIEKFEDKERLKYTDLPKRLKTHKHEDIFTDRFKVLDKNGYSHTLTAHIYKDGHQFIYPSLNQIRSISIREAARIQSFPDDYFFEGGQCAAFKQIGNAVPPLMAEGIAKEIKKMLLS
jgi:DNA (cytosine-5)-methyltransferase 1